MRSLEVRAVFYALCDSLKTDLCVFGLGRLTQLIALTGQSGGWRKTIIDRSIAYVQAHLTSRNPPSPTSSQ